MYAYGTRGAAVVTFLFAILLFGSVAGIARAPATRAAQVPAPNLILAVDVAQVGASLTYTITFDNVGEGTAKTVVLRDTLPAGTTFLGDPQLVVNGVWSKAYSALAPGSYRETVALTLPADARDGDRVINLVELEYTGYGSPTVTRTYVHAFGVSLPAAPTPLSPWIAIAPLAAGIALSGGYAVTRSRRRPKLEQVFLMHNSGMLIHHWAANLSPHRDIDILSAMFVILKDFVRDSFREKSGGLTEFQFGDSRVFLAEGHRSILAAVVRGKHVNGLPGQFAAAVQDFERRSSEVLADWSGQLDVLPDAKVVVDGLVEGQYSGRRVAA